MAQNFAPFPFGRVQATGTYPSGIGVIGEIYQDKEGNEFRMVLNAGSVKIEDGQPCEFKTAAEFPSGVIATSAESGIGKIFAGVAYVGLESDTQVEAGETFFVLTKGQHHNGFHSSENIVAGDALTVSTSGSLKEAVGTTYDATIPQAVIVGRALEAGIWETTGATSSGTLRFIVE